MKLLCMPLCVSFGGRRHSFLLAVSVSDWSCVLEGRPRLLYLVCSSLLPKGSKQVSESREVGKALVSSMSGRRVWVREAGAGKTPGAT